MRRPWAHLGLETQRQWSDQAIARTTPVLLGLFSLVTLAALLPRGGAPFARADGLVCQGGADLLGLPAADPARIWQARIGGASGGEADVIQLPQGVFEAVVQGLATAA